MLGLASRASFAFRASGHGPSLDAPGHDREAVARYGFVPVAAEVAVSPDEVSMFSSA